MTRYTNPLDHVRVAAPCPANWDAMFGDDRTRFCGECKLNVYNLSGMSRSEAEALLSRTEGRLCVRYYQRADGTIITKNCPVGLQAVKQRLSRIKRSVISMVLSFLTGLGLYSMWRPAVDILDRHVESEPRYPVMGTIAARPTPEPVVQGKVAFDRVTGGVTVTAGKPLHGKNPTVPETPAGKP
jgi:hypothetical protein